MEHQQPSVLVTRGRLVWRVLAKSRDHNTSWKAIPFHSSGDHFPNVQAFGVRTKGLIGLSTAVTYCDSLLRMVVSRAPDWSLGKLARNVVHSLTRLLIVLRESLARARLPSEVTWRTGCSSHNYTLPRNSSITRGCAHGCFMVLIYDHITAFVFIFVSFLRESLQYVNI